MSFQGVIVIGTMYARIVDSHKLACLYADGKLQPGDVSRQESVIGTTFEASFTIDAPHRDRVLPRVTGAAHITAEATRFFDDTDPLRWAINHRGRASMCSLSAAATRGRSAYRRRC